MSRHVEVLIGHRTQRDRQVFLDPSLELNILDIGANRSVVLKRVVPVAHVLVAVVVVVGDVSVVSAAVVIVVLRLVAILMIVVMMVVTVVVPTRPMVLPSPMAAVWLLIRIP